MNKVVDYILTNKPDWVIAKQLKEILEVRKESGNTVNEKSSSIPGSKESIAKLYEGQNIFIKYPKSTKAFSVTIVGTLDFNKSLQGLTNTGKEVSFDIWDIQLDTVIGYKLSTLLNNYYTALKNSDPSNEINLDKTLKVMPTNQQDTLTDKYNPLGNRWPEEFESWVKSKNIPFKEISLWGASNKTYEEIMNFTPSSILTEELYNKLIAAKTNKERASLLVTAKSRDSDNMTDEEFDKYLEESNEYSKKLTDLGINLNKETDLSDSVINKLFGKASDSIPNKDDEFIFNPDQSKAIKELNQVEDGNSIYDKLGDKTESGNVRIVKNIFANKENKDIITAFRVDKKIGLLESFNKYTAIGNPINWQKFTPRFENDNATKAFIDWLLGNDYKELEQEYRKTLLENIEELKGKTIEYYKELGAPSHATALDYLINKYVWKTEEKATQKQEDGIIDSVQYVQDNLAPWIELDKKSKDALTKIKDQTALDKLIEDINCRKG